MLFHKDESLYTWYIFKIISLQICQPFEQLAKSQMKNIPIHWSAEQMGSIDEKTGVPL